MQQLTRNVFVETQIRGCNHGFVTTSDGIVMIDSPHKPSDAAVMLTTKQGLTHLLTKLFRREYDYV